MDEQVDLGERIALARSAKGLSQQELASRVRIDRTALSKIESGVRRVSALELAAVAEALQRPLSWFLSDSPAVIVSRRAELIRGDEDPAEPDAELTLENLVREVQLLEDLGVLLQTRKPLDMPMKVEAEGDARIAGERREGTVPTPRAPSVTLRQSWSSSACTHTHYLSQDRSTGSCCTWSRARGYAW